MVSARKGSGRCGIRTSTRTKFCEWCSLENYSRLVQIAVLTVSSYVVYGRKPVADAANA
jgi:hypothetical protein